VLKHTLTRPDGPQSRISLRGRDDSRGKPRADRVPQVHGADYQAVRPYPTQLRPLAHLPVQDTASLETVDAQATRSAPPSVRAPDHIEKGLRHRGKVVSQAGVAGIDPHPSSPNKVPLHPSVPRYASGSCVSCGIVPPAPLAVACLPV